VSVRDVVIPAGEWVFPAISSANRDPAQFPDPDHLDLGRDTSGHVGFGHGVHHCLGAPLARMEAEVALGALLARFPQLSLAVPAEELRWRPRQRDERPRVPPGPPHLTGRQNLCLGTEMPD
jgi:cytochrome P450